MTASLEEKLAMVLWYITESDAKRMSIDAAALRSYLDDKEITDWLDARNRKGQIKNTRFTHSRERVPEPMRSHKR
jgi:hypothetical protein